MGWCGQQLQICRCTHTPAYLHAPCCQLVLRVLQPLLEVHEDKHTLGQQQQMRGGGQAAGRHGSGH